MTRTNYQLDDVGGALSWSALNSFIRNLRTDSALARDLGRSTGWEDTLETNILLADIYDMLQVIAVMLSGKKKNIKPYPRPGRDEDKKKKLGKGAMPLDALRNWIKERSHG